MQSLGEGDVTPADTDRGGRVDSETGLSFKATRGLTQLGKGSPDSTKSTPPLCCGRSFLNGTFLSCLDLALTYFFSSLLTVLPTAPAQVLLSSICEEVFSLAQLCLNVGVSAKSIC